MNTILDIKAISPDLDEHLNTTNFDLLNDGLIYNLTTCYRIVVTNDSDQLNISFRTNYFVTYYLIPIIV